MKHNVGDGWVMLRDPKKVAERYRRPIIAKATAMQRAAEKVRAEADSGMDLSEDEFLALYQFNDLVAVALIESWSWDMPVSLEGLLDLPAVDYDEILRVTAPMITDLMPKFEPDMENNDPESPTESSVE